MKIERCKYCMHAKTKSKPHFCAGSEYKRILNAKRKQRDAVVEVVKERRR